MAAESLHVTLVFLGRREAGQAPLLWTRAREAAGRLPAPTLVPAGIVPVPTSRPHLLALDLLEGDGRAQALHGAVAGALAAGGLHEPERRPFWPHVTLARVRRGARVRLPDAGAAPLSRALVPTALALYRSDLSPRGARYTALERHPLEPG